ncbi:MAG: phenylalanine--tRNA ligase subunit alpha, partial [Haloarculaceae archaeon]
MKLPPTQVAVLEAASPTESRTVAQLAEETGEKPEAVTRAAFELEDRGLVTVEESTETDLELTAEGEEYAAAGLPEQTLWATALSLGADEEPVPMDEVMVTAGLEGDRADVAISNFARKGLGEIDAGDITIDPHVDLEGDEERRLLEALWNDDLDAVEYDESTVEQLERRGLVESSERTVRSVTVTDEGTTALMEGVEAADLVDRLTPELITSGEWEDVEFADYNVEADVETGYGGREHPLRGMAERVKDVLVGMGFEEMQGPHVDADFYIHDCLFMPQDHPAREHWDRFAMAEPSKIDDLPDDLVDTVESAHREGVGPDGEGYNSPWDEEFARALALRGHTTNLSVRHLAGMAEGDLEPPQRYFSVEKAYRNDTLD